MESVARGVSIFFFSAVVLAAQCSYTTLAGRAVTFAGEGVPVASSLFYNPAGIAAASDGSIFIADTGNNRIRRIDASGIIRTVAGTGEASFSGDSGPALLAALKGPTGMALSTDGILYFSDTQNHRVRAVDTDGKIRTVAGNGAWKFAGDNGPATAASLNLPGDLAFDSGGNLLIADSGNARVRRVDKQGIITTLAGSKTPAEYAYSENYSVVATPATQYEIKLNFGASLRLSADPKGEIYITDRNAIWSLGTDGILRPWLPFWLDSGGTTKVTSMPLADFHTDSATITPLADGTQILGTSLGLLRVSSGNATFVSNAYLPRFVAFDPSTGGVATITPGPFYFYFPLSSPPIIARQLVDGTSSPVYTNTQSDPTGANPLNLTLAPTGALVIGADGTIYFGESTPAAKAPFGRIVALSPDGTMRVVTTTSEPPVSFALDSKGMLYFVQSSGGIYKVPVTGGTRQSVDARNIFGGVVLALAIDAQDRIYFLTDSKSFPLVRIDTDGTAHSVLHTSFPIFEPGNRALTVTPDGTLYAGFDASVSTIGSSVLRITASGSYSTLPMESIVSPHTIVPPTASDIYLASGGKVTRLLPDGTMITVFGSDLQGFHGEKGLDSEPGSVDIRGIALSADGNLIVADGFGGIRRINLAGCSPSPTPVIEGIGDSAVGTAARRTAGQLFSIYGERLGPANGIITQFDTQGHLPTEIAGVKVLVNGIPAPLLYVSASQINAIVPFALEGHGTGRISVQYKDKVSDEVSQDFGYYGPTVFRSTSIFALMINQDGTLNSAANPAHTGSVVTIYATGTGATSAPGDDGRQAGLPLKYTAQPLGIQVGGKPVEVLYSGDAPYLVEGTTQINFRVPAVQQDQQLQLAIDMGPDFQGNSVFFFAAK